MAAELHQLLTGKYFLATKLDRSLPFGEPGAPPNTINFAGQIKECTSDHRYFLVHIFSRADELEGEHVKLSQRIMSIEELVKASLFPDYESMELAAANHLQTIESINLE